MGFNKINMYFNYIKYKYIYRSKRVTVIDLNLILYIYWLPKQYNTN